MSGVELLTCPFCGSRPSIETEKRCHAIMCLNPDCGEVMTRWFMSADEATAAWNTRTHPASNARQDEGTVV